MNRHRLLFVFCVGLLAQPLLAQDANDPAMELYYAANAAYNRKLYPIASGNFELFVNRYRTHEKVQLARYGWGLSQFALKQYDRAVHQFAHLLKEKTLDKKIERDRLTLLHAQCLLYSNKKDEAQKQLIEAAGTLKPGPHKTGAMAAVTDLFFNKSDWANTIFWSKKLQGAKPGAGQLIRAGYQEGYALFKLKKYPEAIAVLDKIKAAAAKAESEAWLTRLNFLLSECHTANASLGKAETSLQTAIKGLTGRSAVDALYRLANIRFNQQKWVEAQADYEAFLKAVPKLPKRTKGKGKNAVVEVDPRVRVAELRIGRCLMEQKETRKADQKFGHLGNGNDEVAANAILWRGRLYSRDAKHEQAANVLRSAVERKWYKNGFRAKSNEKPSTVVADIDFEYANALMLQKRPNWELAIKLLQRVRSRRRDYKQLAEVLSQEAICQHKLKQFDPSYRTTELFLKTFAKHKLAGDIRFLYAENLFLMNKLPEATTAYGTFISTDKGHTSQPMAAFRIAQIHHHTQKWEESNKLAVPLLAKKPEGKLFMQLSFVVGENYFRQGKWAESVPPMEAFVAGYLKEPKNKKGRVQLTKGPNVDTALMELGVAYARLGKKDEAIGRLTLLVANYGSTESQHLPLALSEQGKLLYDAGELKKARQALERFVGERKNKKNTIFHAATAEVGRVHYYLGWIDSVENRHAQAAVNFGIATAQSGGRRGKGGSPLGSDAALQQGIALVNAKDFENAAKHFQNVGNQFKDHPRRDLVTYYTGLSYARVKNWRSATGYFKRVVEEFPKAPFADKALYEWAWCERAQKRKKEATERYELLLANYPKSKLSIKVQSELAELNLDAGAQDAVIAKLAETMKSVTDPKLKFELKYQLASAHFKKKDYESSAKMFEALLPEAEKSPLLSSILFQAGESRLMLTETVPARDHYLTAHSLKKGVPAVLAESILMRLGETQNITGQHKESEKSYRLFMQRYRQSQWIRNARYGMAYAMEKQQNYKKAIGEYHQLLPNDPKKRQRVDKWMVQARYQIGECYFNLREYDKAMAEFVSVDANYRQYPDYQAKAVLEMGRVYLSQGKKSDAASRLKETIKRFPRSKAAAVAQKYLDEIRKGG